MKTILVTGATDGIGRATAAALSAAGHRVLVHGRSLARADAACAALRADGGDAVPVWGDFTRPDEVVALAAQATAATRRLDVLINNAGLYAGRRQLTMAGFETTLAVNHYAPFLLTHRLLPLLEATPASRIVNVSSMTHVDGTLDLDDMDMQRGFTSYAAYARSKLCNILFTHELAQRLAHTTVNALHPGVIGTKLLRGAFGMAGGTVESGARTPVHLALAPEVAQVSGGYFVDCRQREPGAQARDAALADALWQHTEQRLAPWLA